MDNMDKVPPVDEGQIIEELKIVGIGKKGDGVGKVDNFAIIVPNTQEGQTYKVKINKVYPNVAFGTIDFEPEQETEQTEQTEETSEE